MEHIEYNKIQGIGFKANNNYFIYDRFSNNIVQVNEFIFNHLDDLIDNNIKLENKYDGLIPKQELEANINTIRTLKEECATFHSYSIPKFGINNLSESKIEKLINNNLSVLTFNITEECNLRCIYCYYSGNYNYRRKHNNVSAITFDMAQKAIDYFIPRTASANYKAISFFGGEPLINFSLVEKIVDYVSKKDAEIHFTLSTNGTLLKDRILKFLVQNNVALLISLDGPKSIHDKNRRFKNLKGSHDIVISNIEKLKLRYPKYYVEKVRFNSVLVDHENIFSIYNDYFMNSEFHDKCEFSRILLSYSSYYYSFVDEFLLNYKEQHINGFKSIMDVPSILKNNELHKIFMTFHWRDYKSLNQYKENWPNGICIPGIRELFVSNEGNFYPCNKLYDQNSLLIGDVNEGLNAKVIKKIVTNYSKIINNKCKICWASRLCKTCFKTLSSEDSSSLLNREYYCTDYKLLLAKIITTYTEIIQNNPNAFSIY